MSIFPLRSCLLLALSPLTGAEAATILSNGEFTGSLAAWTTTGTVFNTGDAAVFADGASATVSLFQTGALPAGVVSLALTFDYFNGLSPTVAGGFLRDTFFATLYGGGQPFGPTLAGGVYDQVLGLFDLDANGAFNVVPGSSFEPSPKGAGWTRYTLTQTGEPAFMGPGFATVAFEFYNLNGIAADSAAAVDNVSLVAVVPEPTETALLLLSATVLLRRRRLPLHRP